MYNFGMEKVRWGQVRFNQKRESVPGMRWGHSCCVIKDEIVLFGGYADNNYMSDMWTFNTITMEWNEVMIVGDAPAQRSNCTMHYDEANNRIVLFGGGGAQKRRYNTISLLDWKTKEWIDIAPKQDEPAPEERTYHTSELAYPYLIVFGGEGVCDLDDLWVFNFLNLGWRQVPIDKTGVRPCARRFHSSALLGNQLFIIAGCYAKYRCLSDVYSIDLTDLLERQCVDKLSWRERKLHSTTFLTRWGHSSAVHDGKIYIFGGRFSSDLNDVLAADIAKNTMTTLKVSSADVPKARRRHSACFIGSNMLVFGGFNGYYFNDLHYINVFQPRNKLVVKMPEKIGYVGKMINGPFADGQVHSQEGMKLSVCKGLMAKSFLKTEMIEAFLSEIDRKYGLLELNRMMNCLYVGHGQLDSILRHQFGINLAADEREFELCRRRSILQDVRQRIAPSRRNQPENQLIQLDSSQFQDQLQRQRCSGYTDIVLVVNEGYYIGANRAQLALNSAYFSNIFSQVYAQQGEVKIAMQHNSIILFELLLNYLTTGLLVVPREMTCLNWMSLLQIGHYYCAQNLVSICESQLVKMIEDRNCQMLIAFALEYNLSALSQLCAEYLIKMMVNREQDYNIFFEEVKDEYLARMKEQVLKEVYALLRFDILQKKIQKEEILASRQLQKMNSENDSENTAAEEKENFENRQWNDI